MKMCVCTVVKFIYQKIRTKHSTLSKTLCRKFICEHVCYMHVKGCVCVCAHLCGNSGTCFCMHV